MTLREWLRDGPWTLTLSSGFFGFYAHLGFLSALDEEGLEPEAVTGSSAGAMVGGLWASGRSIADLEARLLSVDRAEFWDPGPGAGLLKGERFIEILREMLGVPTFEECRVPVAMTVFDVASLASRVADSGDLALAIRASCTFPGLFHPARMDGRATIDGGVADRPGLMGVRPGARVLYHHLSTRSRLRRRVPSLTACPRGDDMVSVIVRGLPRVHPFALDRGKLALETARGAMRAALDRPAVPGGSPLFTSHGLG